MSKNEKISPLNLFFDKRFLVLAFGIVGFISPMIYGCVVGFPIPYFHDELSYFLAADTYASGRLTNPTPAFSEHFEAPHILMEPSYASKYPPAQGLFMAAGQVLFGHPIFGVWLSCGVSAAALFWMLSVWTNRKWACLGALLMISFIGINSYWAQSYWGGMIAAAGGSIFLGGFRQSYRKLSASSTLLMTLGGIILVNSRPFEGTAMMLPALCVLLFRLLGKSDVSLSKKFFRVVLPGVFATFLTLSAMGYYNYRVTGNALRFPYTEHQTQYFSTPLFIFQKPAESERRGHYRLQKLYDSLNGSYPIKNLDDYGLPDNRYLFPIYAFVFLIQNLPYLLLMPPLLIFGFVTLIPLAVKSRWTRFIIITVLFTFFCMSFAAYWDNAHYSAPLTSCFYLLIVQGFRLITVFFKNAQQKKIAVTILVSLTLTSLLYQNFFIDAWFFPIQTLTKREDMSAVKLNLEKSNVLLVETPTQIKPFIEDAVADEPQKYLILVSYDDSFNSLEDLVYNRADIENSKTIWASDLGNEKNSNLLNYYKDRKVLLLKAKNSQIEISPYKNSNFDTSKLTFLKLEFERLGN